MSYRRLFHILLIGSTLMLAGVWWYSFGTARAFSAATYKPLCFFQALLVHSNVTLHWEDTPHAGWQSNCVSLFNVENDPFFENQIGLFGNFIFYDLTGEDHCGPFRSIGVTFPLWVLWILFVGSSFAFCRVMERRAGVRKEKELAVEQAAEKLGRETD